MEYRAEKSAALLPLIAGGAVAAGVALGAFLIGGAKLGVFPSLPNVLPQVSDALLGIQAVCQEKAAVNPRPTLFIGCGIFE